ncbi:DUF4279 domain-containing protein [Psychrobacillus sp. FJAT-21963]|uniref:DUF4279 domain-containing protein n=1 Tax=Psychrobacillus sp. FJAT-21963 TaxID=1712028 RepID=UPI0006F7A1AF|nr:DUF4279 domain-containing protein [Psychrobacillus sp. FJAT-21963]
MEKDCAFIRFSLVADEWPIDAFTTEIGILPTEAYKIGDDYIIGTRQRKRFETVWSLESGEMKLHFEEDMDKDLFESLIAPLRTHIKLINAYKEKYQLTCIFFVHYNFYNAQTPGMRLDPTIIAFAHSIGAIIDIYIDNETDWEDLLYVN